MCYDVAYLTKRWEKYYERFEKSTLPEIEREQLHLFPKAWHRNAFDHPDLPTIISDQPDKIQRLTWGLMPFWARSFEQSLTLARAETLFENKNFKHCVATRRAIVWMDGWWDYHKVKRKSFPHYIYLKNQEPIAVAAIWRTWMDKEHDLERYTLSLITVSANLTISIVHNQPVNSKDSRMYMIIPPGREMDWLKPGEEVTKEQVEELMKPYPDEMVTAHPTKKLFEQRGRSRTALNTPELMEPFHYPELQNQQGELF